MKKTNVAVIGCGVIAPSHIESYQLLPGVEVVTLCDVIPERAQNLAKKYSVARCAASAAEIFADKIIDAVSVCTPHYNHAELVIAALDSGKDVICEKPVSNSIAGLNKLVRAVRAHPERVAAGVFQHRFNPLYESLRDMLASGSFGRPLTASVSHRLYRSPEYFRADAWRGTIDLEGGGVLINQSIHFLDLLQWIMGGVKKTLGFSANLAHRGIIDTEDVVAGALVFKNGALGTIEATSGAILDWETSLNITGTDGVVEIRDGAVKKAVFKNTKTAELLEKACSVDCAERVKLIGKHYYGYGHAAQIADFVQAVRLGARPKVTIEDAAEAARLVLKLYKSAAS